jgi:pilus assembly protein Flp/PilA
MSVRDALLKRLPRLIGRLAADVRAATAVEYGLVVTLIVIASIAALIQVAGTTGDIWNDVSNKVTSAH